MYYMIKKIKNALPQSFRGGDFYHITKTRGGFRGRFRSFGFRGQVGVYKFA